MDANDPQPKSPKHDSRTGRFVLWLLVIVAALGVALLLDLAGQGGEGLVPWMDEYDQALATAAATGKPLLVDFTADWCPPCRQMESQVYAQQRVADAVVAGFMPVKVDMTQPGPAAQRIAERYNVQYLPTLLILMPGGEVVSARAGYQDADALLAWLDAAVPPAPHNQAGLAR